jgi:hypothetical protein
MALWGKTDALASVPKWLEDDANNTNKSHDRDNAVFVDLTEAGVAANRAKGLKTPGWNLYHTYTDALGNTRHKAESLVVMKVSAGDAGDEGVVVINATDMANNTVYTIVTIGTTDFTEIGAANNEVGLEFTSDFSTNTAAGTGTVALSDDPIVADS